MLTVLVYFSSSFIIYQQAADLEDRLQSLGSLEIQAGSKPEGQLPRYELVQAILVDETYHVGGS